jgi:hypothetical protein
MNSINFLLNQKKKEINLLLQKYATTKIRFSTIHLS